MFYLPQHAFFNIFFFVCKCKQIVRRQVYQQTLPHENSFTDKHAEGLKKTRDFSFLGGVGQGRIPFYLGGQSEDLLLCDCDIGEPAREYILLVIPNLSLFFYSSGEVTRFRFRHHQ